MRPILCRGLLLKGPVVAFDVVPARNVCWLNVLCIGTLHGSSFLWCCLACRHSNVTIFMGKSLVLSQLQCLSEVLAEAFYSVQRRWGFTVNIHKKTHSILDMNGQSILDISICSVHTRFRKSHVQHHITIKPTHCFNCKQRLMWTLLN